MAKSTNNQIMIDSLTATGRSDWLPAADNLNDGNITYQITGTFVGTIDLQRSRDGGNNWDDVVGETFTIPADGIITTGSNKFLYAMNCSAFTSGTINIVMAQ